MDPQGKVLADEAAARKAGEQLASYLQKHPLNEADWRVMVTDEAGAEIALIPAATPTPQD
jgi:hypothetical protein